MDIFGSTDPKLMPKHLFWGALHLDYSSAIPGNPDRQHYSVCPRHWHINASFKCNMCGIHFVWSAEEQKKLFEEWGFWIDSHPNQCQACWKKRQSIKAARQEYDAIVDQAKGRGELELKTRVLSLIDEMGGIESGIPKKMKDTYLLFQEQIRKAVEQGAQPDAFGAG